jgi:hypothetical protein
MIYRYIEDSDAIVPLKAQSQLSVCDDNNVLFCVFDSDVLQSASITVTGFVDGDSLLCGNEGGVKFNYGGEHYGSVCNYNVQDRTVSQIQTAMRHAHFYSSAESTGTRRTFQYIVDGQVHVETFVDVYNNANDAPEMSDLPQRSLFMFDETKVG